MSWIEDHKDAGPGILLKQMNKYGYLNNKRWSSEILARRFCLHRNLPLNPSEHFPCGHWHKPEPELIEDEY